MGASSKTPPVPDYTGAAQTQGALDAQIAQQLTQANRPTQIDPYGTTTWKQTPDQSAIDSASKAYNDFMGSQRAYLGGEGIPEERDRLKAALDAAVKGGPWTQTTTYTPAQQALLNQKQTIQGTQNDMISQLLAKYQGNMPQQAATQAFNPVALQQTPGLQQVGLQQASQNNVANDMYRQLTMNMDPQFQRDEASQRQQLANQGFQMGSEGYNNALNDFFKNKNQAYENANLQANLAGYNQMNTENAQNLQNYTGQNSYLLNSYLGQRGANLNDYNAQNTQGLNKYIAQHNANLADYSTQMGYLAQLLGGTQGPASIQSTYPQFAQATNYQAPDLLGALSGQYQAALNSTNAQNAARGQNMNALGNLASIGAMAFL